MHSLGPYLGGETRESLLVTSYSGRYKGRVYGVRHVNPHDDCVESYLQHTQACSTQHVHSKKISQLRQRLTTSEAWLSTSEK